MNRKRAGAESEPGLPADLRKALAALPEARAKWMGLTPIARMDFLLWIDSAKQAETRQRRVERTCEMVSEGKRRPCCFSVVPFDLHKALAAAPKAKAQWSVLTGMERREFIRWIDSSKEADARKGRLEKACALLAAAKRAPETSRP